MIRKANALWRGTGRDGEGELTSASRILSETPYSYKTRFEGDPGTNPEELIAAAHAGCFSMALSNILAGDGHLPESVSTTAKVHLRFVDDAPTIAQIDLVTVGRVPGIDQDQFAGYAEQAKAGCPVSRALAAVGDVTLDAKLAD